MNVCTEFLSTRYQFFPVTSNQISFEVKASEGASVILTSQPSEEKPCYEIIFGDERNTRTFIRKNQQEPSVVEAKTRGILDWFNYKRFWIRWDYGTIAAGVSGSYTPTVSYHDPSSFPIRYYGVRTPKGTSGDWRIDLQPSSSAMGGQQSYEPHYNSPNYHPPPHYHPSHYHSPMGAQQPYNPHYPSSAPKWISGSRGSLPPNAVVGGKDLNGEQVYVARASHAGALLPGKFVPSHGVTYVAWGGKEISKDVYEILCDCVPQWIPTNGSNLPYGAMVCGRTEDGESLYVGRAYHETVMVPGKVQLSHGVCYIPFNGNEVRKSQYEVLRV